MCDIHTETVFKGSLEKLKNNTSGRSKTLDSRNNHLPLESNHLWESGDDLETLAWGFFSFHLNGEVEPHSVLVQSILEPKLF